MTLARTGARRSWSSAGSLRARALIGLAHVHFFQGRQLAVSALAAEALSLGHEDNDAWVVAFALFMQGTSAFESGDNEQAEARSQEALDAANASGDPWLRAPPLLILGHVAASKGDLERAERLYAESIDVQRRAGETWGLGIVLAASASVAIAREDFTQARLQAFEALSLCEELEDPRGIAWSLEVFADWLAASGRPGKRLAYGAPQRVDWNTWAGHLPRPSDGSGIRNIERVREAIGDTSFETPDPRGVQCRPHRRLPSRVNRYFYTAESGPRQYCKLCDR